MTYVLLAALTFVIGIVIFSIVMILLSPNTISDGNVPKIIKSSEIETPPHTQKVFEYESKGVTYKNFNPSIVSTEDGFLLCCRKTNRSKKNVLAILLCALMKKSYKSSVEFIYLTKDMKVMKVKKIKGVKSTKELLEDPRICTHKEKYYVSVVKNRPDTNDIYPVLQVYNKNLELERTIEFNRLHYNGQNQGPQIQKNWCPFTHQDKLLIHTDSFPTWRVFEISDEDGSMTRVHESDVSSFFASVISLPVKGSRTDFSFIRCSTGWKEFTPSTYICGVHVKNKVPESEVPIIRSILVEVDKETLAPLRKTPIFNIAHMKKKIEFLSGIETDSDDVYLSYGVGDYKTEVSKMTKETIKQMLHVPNVTSK